MVITHQIVWQQLIHDQYIHQREAVIQNLSKILNSFVVLDLSHLISCRNLSKAELASLARRKKKQADHGKRTTFAEAREAMGLYLESVCYYIQCANDETKQDQRTALLATTLTMLT